MSKYRMEFIDDIEVDSPQYEYFSDLQDSDLLRYRLPEHERPTVVDMVAIILAAESKTYIIYSQDSPFPVAEATLCNFQGRSAMIHISAHPSIFGKESVEIGKWVCKEFLTKCTYPDGTKLLTLIGLTPVTNRLAVSFLRKVGYKEKTILTNVFILGNDKNRIVNGVLSQLEAHEV